MSRDAALDALQERLAYRFKDRALLERALTHKSRGDGQPGFAHNERLEWLGDRVLGLKTAERLFTLHGREEEGALTKRFNAIVSGDNCAKAARLLGLHELIVVSRGLSDAAVRDNDSILGDAFEALMAAIWIDAGPSDQHNAIAQLYEVVWAQGTAGVTTIKNPKSALQEWAQKRGLSPPTYEVLERDGPDHAPRFNIRATVGGKSVTAWGQSKQSAEREAALALLTGGALNV
jgi:ribonuclease III